LNYNGTESFRPTLIAIQALRKPGLRLLPIRANPRLWKSSPCRERGFPDQSKSFRPSAKPTRPNVPTLRVDKGLAMAHDMLPFGSDEVARNGASWKLLRPEVFPNAPLHMLRLSDQSALRPVSRPSPESPPASRGLAGNGRSAV